MTILKYYADLKSIIDKVQVNGGKIAFDTAVALAIETIRSGNKIIFIGNGASAAISSHMAADYCKNGGFAAIALNDPALLTCVSNDCGYEDVFSRPIEIIAKKGDVLVAISSSGSSKNILNAVNAAKNIGCKVITFSGFKKDNPLSKLGDINFYVPSDKYSHVEIIHHSICHYMLDIILEGKDA